MRDAAGESGREVSTGEVRGANGALTYSAYIYASLSGTRSGTLCESE